MREQVTETSHNDSYSRLWMTVGRSMSAKFASMTWRSKWTLRLEKFSENALWASSSQNRRERGAELEDEEALEWKEFRAGEDLRLGAIDMTIVNRKRGRERKTIRKVLSNSNKTSILKRDYVCIGNAEHVTCKTNCIMGSVQSKPISTQIDCTHLNAWEYYYNGNVMQCMRF